MSLSCMPPVHAYCLMEEVQDPTTVFGGTFVRSCFSRHQTCSFFRPSGVLLWTTSGTRLDGYILKTSSGKHLLADLFLDKVSQVSSSIMVCGRGVHLLLPSIRRVCFLLFHGWAQVCIYLVMPHGWGSWVVPGCLILLLGHSAYIGFGIFF